MDMAMDSPIVSKLFTQERHRNASVILLLQNAFLNGKIQYEYKSKCSLYRRFSDVPLTEGK